MQNKEKLLEVSHVRKVFPVKKQQLRAVSDVSFSISRGEILGIVGESRRSADHQRTGAPRRDHSASDGSQDEHQSRQNLRD